VGKAGTTRPRRSHCGARIMSAARIASGSARTDRHTERRSKALAERRGDTGYHLSCLIGVINPSTRACRKNSGSCGFWEGNGFSGAGQAAKNAGSSFGLPKLNLRPDGRLHSEPGQ